MRYRQIDATGGRRTLVAVLAPGDEVLASLQKLAEDEKLTAAQVAAIGAFERATLAYFDWESKQYQHIPVAEQVEVLSLNGNISLDENNKAKLHLHAVLGRRDGSTVGGHLIEGRVRPTLEAVITESPAHLHRRHDPRSGLALIDPEIAGTG
jgi:predicted DNA-binding protein with PD1-like motif